jgi:UDP-N-acetylmuramoyl-L-alanyl-D-glutamate--2,6-diaminopimelate ligase
MTPVHGRDATEVELRPGRSTFTWKGHRVTTPLTGAVNVGNALLAAEAALALGLTVSEVVEALSRVAPVTGRLQVVAAPPVDGSDHPERPPFTVLVDYAHTPAGLEVVLGEARGLTGTDGRVVVVFGCGGNRDRDKRPMMGRAAAELSDVAYLTSDNPRDEDPLAIIAQVEAGMGPDGTRRAQVAVEPDRRVAITRALDQSGPGDVVVIAGKGHETYQEIGGRRLPFDDLVEARQALSRRFPSDPTSWIS